VSFCPNHPQTESVAECDGCQRPFCAACLVTLLGQRLCAECKEQRLATAIAPRPRNSAESIAALIVALIAAVPCQYAAPLVAPIAIYLGVMARRKLQERSGLGGHNMAMAAIVMSSATLICWVVALVVVLAGLAGRG